MLYSGQRILNNRFDRRCSFCRSPGHNITRCHSDRITEFEVLCANEVRIINHPDDFKNWLSVNYSQSPMLLKSFVITKFGYTTRITVPKCIDVITDYIFRTYKNTSLHNREQALINDLSEELDTNSSAFENDIVNFLTRLRNVEYAEREPEWHEIPGIERMVMRELFLYYSNNIAHQEASAPINNTNFDITLVLNTDKEKDKDKENMMCNICWDEKDKITFVTFGCSHEFCKECVISSLKNDTRKHPCCALCRSEVREMKYNTEDVRLELEAFVA